MCSSCIPNGKKTISISKLLDLRSPAFLFPSPFTLEFSETWGNGGRGNFLSLKLG